MLLSHSNRNDHASMLFDTESLVQSESLKNKNDLSESNQGNTADLKMVSSKKKIDFSHFYWLLMICFLLIIVGSAVFIFFTKDSGNKTTVYCSFILLEYDTC